MITKDLGAVSAYAYAVEKGYTGTEEEYAELMASYATVAEQASQSAQTATEKAQQASASATSASQSADTASASAQTAQTAQQTATAKASEAQQSATTATTKAQEASQSASESSQSASTAVQAKQDAQTAKTASETAQGLAESARDDAIDAKTDAETARDLAQQYAESINPENIFSAYATDTASGSVASFADGADDIPMKSVKVAIEPVQSGSGDPSPDNVRPISGHTQAVVTRTGVNIWDEEWEVGSINVTTGEDEPNNSMVRCAGYIKAFPNKTYYISNPESVVVFFYDAEKNYIDVTTRQNQTFTTPSNAAFIRFRTGFSYGTTYNHDISINYPATDTTYHPGTVQSITIPLGQTVYGGKLDVLSGVLTVDRANIASYNGETLPSTWISDRDAYAQGATPTTGAQVVYQLATPLEIQLDAHAINSLYGVNNIWADSGDTTCVYRADTKAYIAKKIAEAIASLT